MERAPEETATRLAEDKLGLRLTSKQIELICTGVDRHKNPIYLFKPVVNLPEVEKLFINTPSPISHDFIARSEIKQMGTRS